MCDCARVSLQSPSLCTWQQYSGPEPETFGFVFGFSFVFVFSFVFEFVFVFVFVFSFVFVFGFVFVFVFSFVFVFVFAFVFGFGFAYGNNVLVLARHPDFCDRVRGVEEGIGILVVE